MDSVVRHDCDCIVERCVLVIRDALIVPAMSHNLILLLATREAGINASVSPKFQLENSSIDDHSNTLPRRI